MRETADLRGHSRPQHTADMIALQIEIPLRDALSIENIRVNFQTETEKGEILNDRPDKSPAAVETRGRSAFLHFSEDHQHAVAGAALVALDGEDHEAYKGHEHG